MVAGVVQRISAIPSSHRLRIWRERRAQARLRIQASVGWKILSKKIRQPLVEASDGLEARFGP